MATPEQKDTIRASIGRSGSSVPPLGQHFRDLRAAPLTRVALYVNGRLPLPLAAAHDFQRCSLCENVKAHPVSYLCGHSHCYACIRLWLENEWFCPICEQIMDRAPQRHFAEEAALLANFPAWAHSTSVVYSWAGLTFPNT
ncbi:hypothetical protein K438DRAFT_1991379 [Mycena galopus ATCC 62051]|nr:hypothetical protein K438DRAFT_1991379 [Mycena galopus ATCC 62051]